MTFRRSAAVATSFALALNGCGGLQTGWSRVLGKVDTAAQGALSPVITPRSAVAGIDFTITVSTVGSSSCTRADGASVRVSGLIAEVIPYDLQAPRETACTDDLAQLPREVRLRFEKAGDATIRVIAQPRQANGQVPLEFLIPVER